MRRNLRLDSLAAREVERHTTKHGDEQGRVAATARELVRVLGSMKGAAMKFGQVLSTAELPFADEATSAAFRDELRALQSQAVTVE